MIVIAETIVNVLVFGEAPEAAIQSAATSRTPIGVFALRSFFLGIACVLVAGAWLYREEPARVAAGEPLR